jgi:hypothetical protein
MKKAVLFALLIAVTAGAAQAYPFHEPIPNVDYYCDYTGTPPSQAADPGLSLFSITRSIDPGGVLPWWRGTEYFDATWAPGAWDGRKVVFAKPVNMWITGKGYGTRWEFTINPYGPQCKATDIVNDGYGGQTIYFGGCTDGHTRTCYRLY